MIRTGVCLSLFIVMFFLLSACWDRVEIEDRAFVVGIAFDMDEDNPSTTRILSTFQIANLEKFQPGMESANTERAYSNKIVSGETVLETVDELAARMGRLPFFDHLDVIVISEKISEKSDAIAHVLDYFIRNEHIRRGTLVFIGKDGAKAMLEGEMEQKLPALNLQKLTNSANVTNRVIPKTTLGKVHEKLLKNLAYVLPVVTSEQKGQVKMTGGAVINQENLLLGFLNEEEVEGYRLLTGSVRGGVLKFNLGDNQYVYDIKRANYQIKTEIADDRPIQFQVKLRVEGTIAESSGRLNHNNKKNLEKLSMQLSDKLQETTLKTIQKLQKEFHADVIGLGEHLRQNHPHLWGKVKDNWDGRPDGIFVNIDIQVLPQVFIRNFGSANRTDIKRKAD